MPIKTLIMGAAGRDFHNFNTFFRGNKDYEVVAFTATQIPDIEGRLYPKELAGDLYPKGIPIHAEEELLDLIKKHGVEQVVFAYSDVPHEVRDAQGHHGQRRRRGLPPDGHEVHAGQVHQACRVGLRRSDGIRQKSDHEARVPHPARDGLQSRGHPSPDAVRQSRRAGSSALREL